MKLKPAYRERLLDRDARAVGARFYRGILPERLVRDMVAFLRPAHRAAWRRT